jgi:hypothetical protein
MAPIVLCCAVVGEATRFTVPMPHDAWVAGLRYAVFDKMPPSDFPTMPSMLKLYLAWKDGAWVKSNARIEANAAEFESETVDPEFEFMDPCMKLRSILTSGRHHNDQEGVVHVMIQRPRRPPLCDDEPPAKRQRVERGMWLREL